MKYMSLCIGLLVIPFVLTACGTSRVVKEETPVSPDWERHISEKNKVIAEKDREISRLQTELKNIQDEKDRAANLEAELKKALAQLESERKLRIEGNRIVMEDAVLFPSGRAAITDAGRKVLNEIWPVLVKYNDREILIEGHTDNVPIAEKYKDTYKSNWELSCARSLAVLHYFRDKKDAGPSRLGVVGYGEHQPIAKNTTKEGRQQNRRVVIAVGTKIQN